MNARMGMIIVALLLIAGWAAAADFRIQRGISTIATSASTATITAGTDYVAPADINKAFIRITGTKSSGLGHNSGGGTQPPSDFQTWVTNPQNLLTSITFRRYSATASFNTRIEWEIIEYVGPTNGPNRMIVREQTALAGSGSSRLTGGAVTAITNPLDAVVFITGQGHNSATATTLDRGLFYSELVTNRVPQFTRGDGTGDANVSYAIVEFIGKNWEVQRVQHTYLAAGANEAETMTQFINDINKAFLHTQLATNSGTNDEAGHRAWIDSNSNVTFRAAAGASIPTVTMIGAVWIIENTQVDGNQMNVQTWFGNDATGGSEPQTSTQTINQVRDVNQTSIWGEGADASGTGGTPPRGTIGMQLTNTTTVTLWTSDTGNASDYVFQVVEWPSAPTVTASASKTAFTFVVSTVTTKSHSITFGGNCNASAFFFNETTALLDPDGDGNAGKVRPASMRAGIEIFRDYNFAGTTNPADGNIAFNGGTSANPPTSNISVDNEFNDTQYANVSAIDEVAYTNTRTTDGLIPTQRYVFKAINDTNTIRDLNITFVGNSQRTINCPTTKIGTARDLNIFLWDYVEDEYRQVFTTDGTGYGTSSAGMTIEVNVDQNLSHYFETDKNITLLMQGITSTGTGTGSACVHTDFIQLRIHHFVQNPGYCQSESLAPMTITNTGSGSTNIDANFAGAFTGTDLNLVLKVWQGTGTGCGLDAMGGWETDCSISSTTTAPNTTQCKQFNQTNATTGSRLTTGLAAGDTNQLCFSGDLNAGTGPGDHNQSFQTAAN
ncbi:MAG: hypothetical protein AABW68_03455 [archaeon]